MEDIRLSLIQKSQWFQGVPDDALRGLASASRIVEHDAGSYLYSMGEVSTEVYCIITGRVRVAISSSMGQEFAIDDFGADTWIGESSLVGDKGKVLEAQVIEGATILQLPRRAVLAAADAHPIIFRHLFEHLSRQSRQVFEMFGGMLFYPLRARLAGRILLMLNQHGKTVDDGLLLDINLSQSDFARLTLGSRQRINKIFREWNQLGIISMKGSKYTIHDIEAIRGEIELNDFIFNN